MSTADDTVQRIRERVESRGEGSWLLAVSGGVDSMVLLDAAAVVIDRRRLAVATFDHGTGAWATSAAALVANQALQRGVCCVSGCAGTVGRSESEWRTERWRFLRETARDLGARIVTAHTADDQIETFVIRELRGAGPRGLAGLAARSSVARPLLGTFRSEIIRYAEVAGVEYASDPSNQNRRHLRNRVRLDLLPALERASPGFSTSILAVAEKASTWRARMEAIALTFP
ncbi:MAG: tRNA lysidine(34) synthetase TilS, partial [Gemmatimonadota bacterium]|nr:tRNA lysidine(34) synthetase TilS [Gemmatimonadota bacterium]